MLANNSIPRLFSCRAAEPGLRRPESRRLARRRPDEPGDRPRPCRCPVPAAGAADIHHPCGVRSRGMLGRSLPASTPFSCAGVVSTWSRTGSVGAPNLSGYPARRAGSLTRCEQGGAHPRPRPEATHGHSLVETGLSRRFDISAGCRPTTSDCATSTAFCHCLPHLRECAWTSPAAGWEFGPLMTAQISLPVPSGDASQA